MKKRIILVVSILTICCLSFYIYRTSHKFLNEEKSDSLVVSILPLKFIIDEITGKSLDVKVLVPPGSSPETFEPSVKQMNDINQANALFIIGLIDFENSLLNKLYSQENIYNLSESIELLEGNCSHNEHHKHNHGIDPHIWTSPKQLKIMAKNAYENLHLLYPDSVSFTQNYERLKQKIEIADSTVCQLIRSSHVKSFIIFHPALTYYANDYNLTQISIEKEGKEPSASYLANLIDQAKEEKIDKILYQSQLSSSTVEVIANEIKGTPIEIDPLKEDVLNNIIKITEIITDESVNNH